MFDDQYLPSEHEKESWKYDIRPSLMAEQEYVASLGLGELEASRRAFGVFCSFYPNFEVNKPMWCRGDGENPSRGEVK